MTGCPNLIVSCCDIARAIASDDPPGGNGTTNCIGLSGQAFAIFARDMLQRTPKRYFFTLLPPLMMYLTQYTRYLMESSFI
jgi:hypothetical protein